LLRARPWRCAQAADNLVVMVVILQVLVRQQPQPSDLAGLEQRPAVDRPDRVVATENLRQAIGAIRPDGANPAEMIEAQVVEPQRGLRDRQLSCDLPAQR